MILTPPSKFQEEIIDITTQAVLHKKLKAVFDINVSEGLEFDLSSAIKSGIMINFSHHFKIANNRVDILNLSPQSYDQFYTLTDQLETTQLE